MYMGAFSLPWIPSNSRHGLMIGNKSARIDVMEVVADHGPKGVGVGPSLMPDESTTNDLTFRVGFRHHH
jgi:hypothetical protein